MLPTPEQYALGDRLSDIFMPHAQIRRKKIVANNARFVHYTSAEAAIQIIKSKSLWLRNATCMTDFREIRLDFDLLDQFFNDPTKFKPLFEAMNAIYPGIGDEGLAAFNGIWADIQAHTYISCLSESRG